MNFLLYVVIAACAAGTAACIWALAKMRRRERERRIREGYPWDWTLEDEEKAQALLELICDKCREPFRCSQDELDEECAMCPVPDAAYRLAARGRKGEEHERV